MQSIFLWGLVPRGKAPFPNLQKGTKWASGGPNEQNFPDEIIIHRGHAMLCYAFKNKNEPQKQKHTHVEC